MVGQGSLKLKFFGMSAFLITIKEDLKILIDPCISENPYCPVKLEDIEEPDYILVSHASWDHLGDSIKIMASTKKAKMVCGRDVMIYAIQQGIPKDRLECLVPGASSNLIKRRDVEIKAVKSNHISFIKLDKQFLSYLSLGFFILSNHGRIYHPGDTALFGDMKIYGQLYRPDIAILPIGRISAQGHRDMSPQEAAIAVQWINPCITIPMHYMQVKEAKDFAKQVNVIAPSTNVMIMHPGETFTY